GAPSPRAAVADLVEELAPKVGVVVRAAPEGRRRPRLLLDAAHLRAEVRRLEVDRDPAGVDQVDERVRDLLAQPLLDGEPPREQPDEARQLRDPDDLVAGDVADVR